MGLGPEIGEYDDYEWFVPGDVRAPAPEVYATALEDWLREHPLWQVGGGTKVLLVDLDNLRVQPSRLKGRIGATVSLARQADYAAFAGQSGSVERARPHLAEFADRALTVGNAADQADWALLDAAAAAEGDTLQFVIVSNDNIFAALADRGRLTVLSPGVGALSDRLRDRAAEVIDMNVLERGGVGAGAGAGAGVRVGAESRR